jgi:hypothetical protein
LFDQMDNLLHMVRMLRQILVCVLLLCFCQFVRASTACMIRESCTTTTLPRIEPVRDGQTLHIKNVHTFFCSLAIKTEEKTMSTLSDTVMLTFFLTSVEEPLCLRTEISHKSHGSSWPFCMMLQRAEARFSMYR